MTVDYQLINKAASPMAAIVPNVVTLFECIEIEAGTWHAVTNMAHAFFSISITAESQEQFAFSWEGLQYTLTVLPQGYLHSPAICHGLVAQHLEDNNISLACKFFHHMDVTIITGPTEQEVGETLSNIVDVMQKHRREINPKKTQGPCMAGPHPMTPEVTEQTILKYG